MLNLSKSSSIAKIVIDINSDEIICSYITQKKDQFFVNSYKRFLLKNFQINNLIIYNFKDLVDILNSFFLENNIKKRFVYLSLSGDSIIEKFQSQEDSNQEYNNDLYSTAQYSINDSHSYLACLPHYLIFQYKLLFFYLNSDVVKITTISLCKLKILEKYNSRSLNQTNIDITSINNKFNEFIEFIDASNLISFKSNNFNLTEEKPFILKNLGLFLLEND